MAMTFQRESLTVNGVRITMLTAGTGDPLLYLHGAGTFHGFDFALPWAEHFRVMIPYHPNWGESSDAPEMDTVNDYMLHYLELIDQLKIDRAHIVGFSMGGRFAATFGFEHRRRVNKLVLVAPAGLHVPEYPTADLAKIPANEIFGYLAEDQSVILKHLPEKPSAEFIAARQREGASFERLLRSVLISPKFPRWLHRLTMPTLIVWGDKDRIVPVGQLDEWTRLIPGSTAKRYAGAGHLVMEEKPESVTAITEFLRS